MIDRYQKIYINLIVFVEKNASAPFISLVKKEEKFTVKIYSFFFFFLKIKCTLSYMIMLIFRTD